MRELAEKLRRLELTLSGEKGPFNLFALFLREDAPDVWDLVVAAKWIEEDRPAALADISRRVRDSLRTDEITKISRVVVIEGTDPALKAIWSSQDFVETQSPGFLICFKLLRAHAAEMAVATGSIVEGIDVVAHVLRRQGAVLVDVLLDPFLLQAAEEGLRDRVVPAVRPATHASSPWWKSRMT